MRFVHDSLVAQTDTMMLDERCCMLFKVLGVNICRDAFVALSGNGSSLLQAVRADLLASKLS